jgi:NTE family protein
VAKKKVGLALGGGAARGLAHIGVLKVLEREGVPIDMVAGTSAGAIIGAFHAAGYSALRMEEYVLRFNRNTRARLVDLTLPRSGFISGDKIVAEMKRVLRGDKRFDELKKPFACVACDIITGEEIVMNTDSVAEAVHASMAIPVVFNTVYRKGRYLSDGGLVNQVPVNVVRDMGAEYIIAVNVVPRHVHKLKQENKEKQGSGEEKEPQPGLLAVMMNTIDIANSWRVETSMHGADVVIEPHMLSFKPTDFGEGARMILQGEMAAIDAVLKIKSDLAAG